MALDIPYAIVADVSGTFSSLHARVFCHATEHLDKVKKAMLNSLGDVELRVSQTEGHHGNPIEIIEATIAEPHLIDDFFRRIRAEDLETIVGSLDRRIDDGCNLFLKLDKQEAFAGRLRLGSGDDVISVRMRVKAFPARREVALAAAGDYLSRSRDSERGRP
ncbi:MAG: hypothetical protein JW880_05425 [Candidatus Thermoplasmatota archaeon]|nr:hypothetical protein [Candidatus Thermoplasmatota archaeon]